MQTFEALLWECRAARQAALRRPRFLILNALTLAIGVAAFSITFALVDDFVLTPPPYTDPSRLVVIGPLTSSSYLTTISPQQYQALFGLPAFTSIGAASFMRMSPLKAAGDPFMGSNRPVSRSFLETLGVRLAVGRNFTEEEDRPGGANAAIISDLLWTSQFGRATDILTRWIRLDGKALEIVGVLPADFQFLEPIDVLTPLALPAASKDTGNNLVVTARLAPSVSLQRATRSVDGRIKSHKAELGIKTDEMVAATPLWGGLAGPGRPVTLMFLAFGICLLTLVGANIFNLLSLRSILANHGRAIKLALGASTSRLIVPALAEGLLISMLGVGLGLLIAENASQLIASYIPEIWMNATGGLRFSGRAIALAFALGLFFLPLLNAFLAARDAGTRQIAGDLLGGQRVSRSRRSGVLGQTLVVVQIGLAAALLVVSTSFATSLVRSLRMDLGIQPDRVLTLTVAPSLDQYPSGAAVRAFAANVVGRLARIRSARGSAASWAAAIGEPFNVPISVANLPPTPIEFRPVTSGYFDALGIRLLRGRGFTDLDQHSTEPVAIVNGAFGARYLAGQPLGQYLELGLRSSKGPMRVVGVVTDTKQAGPDSSSEPVVYVPLAQTPDGLVAEMRQFLALHFFVPTQDEVGAASEVRKIIRAVSNEQVVTDLGPLSGAIRKLTAPQELDLKVAGSMTLFAILVASGGLYSVISLWVASRKRDLEIKAALGATPRAIALGVVGSTARQMGMGLATGATAGTVACFYLRNTVVGFDLAPLIAIAGVLGSMLCVGICSCLAPVWRAAHVNPALVFREE
jgi:putative ABC transport system permease protein